MFSTPSKILTILLVLLQLIAPLVHAHATEDSSKIGFHLPEFEHLNTHHDSSAVDSAHSTETDHCLIINIETGIKQKKTDGDNAISAAFLPQSFTFNVLIKQILINAPPLNQALHPNTSIRIQPSRAPPTKS